MEAKYDRASEVKAFDELKIGVKGLVDAGIAEIPRIFHHPHLNLTPNPNPPSTMLIPTIDLRGGVFESTVTRESVIANINEAVEKFGFFQAINHGIPIDVMEKMKDGIRGFHEQDSQLRKIFYSRDNTKKVTYNSNFDLYSSPSANWRDTLSCFVAPHVPKTEDLPEICGIATAVRERARCHLVSPCRATAVSPLLHRRSSSTLVSSSSPIMSSSMSGVCASITTASVLRRRSTTVPQGGRCRR